MSLLRHTALDNEGLRMMVSLTRSLPKTIPPASRCYSDSSAFNEDQLPRSSVLSRDRGQNSWNHLVAGVKCLHE